MPTLSTGCGRHSFLNGAGRYFYNWCSISADAILCLLCTFFFVAVLTTAKIYEHENGLKENSKKFKLVWCHSLIIIVEKQ